MTVLEILNQYGFATLASIGMGWFIFFIYNYITKEVSVKLKEASKALISLLDKIRRLDNDLIRLKSKLNTILTIREQEKIKTKINLDKYKEYYETDVNDTNTNK